jgi:hypothetical protein
LGMVEDRCILCVARHCPVVEVGDGVDEDHDASQDV